MHLVPSISCTYLCEKLNPPNSLLFQEAKLTLLYPCFQAPSHRPTVRDSAPPFRVRTMVGLEHLGVLKGEGFHKRQDGLPQAPLRTWQSAEGRWIWWIRKTSGGSNETSLDFGQKGVGCHRLNSARGHWLCLKLHFSCTARWVAITEAIHLFEAC